MNRTNTFLHNQQSSIRNLEVQTRQLAKEMTNKLIDTLPSTIENNPINLERGTHLFKEQFIV